MGENGSLLYDGKSKQHIPAKRIKALETTGAGDSYIGAFVCKLLEGVDYLAAAQFGTLVAGITVTRMGAQPAMPTLEEVVAFAAKV